MHFLLREDYFPLTLALSSIGGEGKKGGQFNALWLINLVLSSIPSPTVLQGGGKEAERPQLLS
jgi:hypothetical protein